MFASDVHYLYRTKAIPINWICPVEKIRAKKINQKVYKNILFGLC